MIQSHFGSIRNKIENIKCVNPNWITHFFHLLQISNRCLLEIYQGIVLLIGAVLDLMRRASYFFTPTKYKNKNVW